MCLKRKDYATRCKLMDIEQLSNRRVRGDLIEMFKLNKGIESVKWVSKIQKSTARSNRRCQLRREVVKNNQRHNFYTNRVANPWNKLPDTVVAASSVNSFKNRLDKLKPTLPYRVSN